MKSPLLIVLGISCTLLGLYILIISFLTIQDRADYHIGCYLSNNPTDNAFRFRTKLRQLKLSGNHSRNIHSKLTNYDLVDPHIHKKSLELTSKVEDYIKKRTLVQKYQQGNMQFLAQLFNARQSYEDCASIIRSTIDMDSNKKLWSQYQACFIRYEGLKKPIDRLYEKRSGYLLQIDSLLTSDAKPNQNINFDFEAELRIIKQRYDRQNAENDKNKGKLIAQLKRIQQKNQTMSSQRDANQRQYIRAKLQMDICLKNLKQFKNCQDIAKALKEYGHVEPVQSLEERIRSKRQILMQMRRLALESKQAGGKNEAITQMYIKRQKQLLQTIKLRLMMGYDQMKECGCSEQTRKKLESDFQSIKIKINLKKKEINNLIFQIQTLETKINQTDKLREKLIEEFTQQTERIRNRQTLNIVSLKERLDILRANLSDVNKEINQLNGKLGSLEFECNQLKDSLSIGLRDSEKITECLKDKDYFQKLRRKAALIFRKNDESQIESREEVSKRFQDITYPDTSSLKQMIRVSKQIEAVKQRRQDKQLESVQELEKERVYEKWAEKERVLQKEVIRVDREISIETSYQRVESYQEQVIVIDYAKSDKDL